MLGDCHSDSPRVGHSHHPIPQLLETDVLSYHSLPIPWKLWDKNQKYLQVFLFTWKCCHCSLQQSFQDHFSYFSQWDREMSHLILLCGMEVSQAAHFVRLSITRHPDWEQESCYIQLPTTAPMKLCGRISVWKYFYFQALGDRVWDRKSLLKNWYCSQKTDT